MPQQIKPRYSHLCHTREQLEIHLILPWWLQNYSLPTSRHRCLPCMKWSPNHLSDGKFVALSFQACAVHPVQSLADHAQVGDLLLTPSIWPMFMGQSTPERVPRQYWHRRAAHSISMRVWLSSARASLLYRRAQAPTHCRGQVEQLRNLSNQIITYTVCSRARASSTTSRPRPRPRPRPRQKQR